MTRTRVRWGRVAALLTSAFIVLGLGGRALGGSPGPAEERAIPQILVEPGMTLWEIARARLGDEADPRPYIEEIRELNELESSELEAGMNLLLP